MVTDGELILAAKRGDDQAFTELFTRYEKPLYRFAYSITLSHDVADDMLQECFIRLYRHLDRIDPDRPLLHLLLCIIRNRSYSWLKSQRHVGELERNLSERFKAMVGRVSSPADLAEQRETADAVR